MFPVWKRHPRTRATFSTGLQSRRPGDTQALDLHCGTYDRELCAPPDASISWRKWRVPFFVSGSIFARPTFLANSSRDDRFASATSSLLRNYWTIPGIERTLKRMYLSQGALCHA
jgi:hypothetical protein